MPPCSFNEHIAGLPKRVYSVPVNERIAIQHLVPTKLKRLTLERDGRTCRMCGQTDSDTDPYDDKPVRIKIRLFVPLSHGGTITLENLMTICSTCAGGLKKIPYIKRPSAQEIINQLEVLPPSDLKALFERLSPSRRSA